jgi:3-oxochol-4-en-24-oyl-CoA dehydrogenase
VNLSDLLSRHGERLAGGATRVGALLAREHSLRLMNLRRVTRSVAGAEPGPEGNVTKLLLAESGHERAAVTAALLGPATAFADGGEGVGAMLLLATRAMSIAGGTSEITRNQIGERILGLPRDPLVK